MLSKKNKSYGDSNSLWAFGGLKSKFHDEWVNWGSTGVTSEVATETLVVQEKPLP